MRCTGRCVGQGYEHDHGGFTETDVEWIRERVQLQGNIHVVQVRPSQRYGFHTQITLRQEARWKTHLDHIIGPKWESDEAYIYNDVKNMGLVDTHPISARIHEDDIAPSFFRGKGKGVDTMEAEEECAKKSFEDLGTKQKNYRGLPLVK